MLRSGAHGLFHRGGQFRAPRGRHPAGRRGRYPLHRSFPPAPDTAWAHVASRPNTPAGCPAPRSISRTILVTDLDGDGTSAGRVELCEIRLKTGQQVDGQPSGDDRSLRAMILPFHHATLPEERDISRRGVWYRHFDRNEGTGNTVR